MAPKEFANGALFHIALFAASAALLALLGPYFFFLAVIAFAYMRMRGAKGGKGAGRLGLDGQMAALFLIFVLAQIPIAAVDWHVVSLAKASPSFKDADLQPYWSSFFGLLLPLLWLGIAYVLFLAKGGLEKPARAYISALLVQNSGLEDFAFFVYGNYLQGKPLFLFPDSWGWLRLQSAFVGHAITSAELVVWCILMLGMALSVSALFSAAYSPNREALRPRA